MSEITVYVAGKIVTVDERNPVGEAVAVRGDRIVTVGSLADVEAALGDEPYAIDRSLADKVMLPGLIDQHLHPILGATTLSTEVIATEDWVLPDVTYPAAHSHDDYLAALRAADQRTPDGEWLFSWGYHSLWHGELSRTILDSVNADRPIAIWQRSCHEMFFNTAALAALDYSPETLPDDPVVAAQIDLDRGHVWERGLFAYAFRGVARHMSSPDRLRRGLEQMVRYLHLNGVTAFNEPGAILMKGGWELYQEILGRDDTPFYSYFLTDGRAPAERGMSLEQSLALADHDLARGSVDDGHKVGFFPKQVKLFADGAVISQLMQMKEPYLDADGNPNPDHHGEWIMPPDVFEERTKLYWDHGFQIHIHVNGDLGLEMVLDSIERRMRENPRPDHRTVVVHFANSTEDQIDRIARLGCIVSSNPYYPVGFADKFGEVGLGPERADVMVRHASVLARNVSLSFHSDLPMGRSDPIGMMSCAVNRVTASGRIAGPEQRISAEAALRAVTIDAAYSWRREHELGSITAGKIANFTIVDRNPLDVAPGDLDHITVAGTFFEGRWFPVPAEAAAAATASLAGTRSLSQLPGMQGHDDHDHRGCICSVAHLIAEALAA